jgi:hypothetical protein
LIWRWKNLKGLAKQAFSPQPKIKGNENKRGQETVFFLKKIVKIPETFG